MKTNDSNLYKELDDIYSLLPETIGCVSCGKCCKVQHPHCFFTEFLNIMRVVEKWSIQDYNKLHLCCIKNYLSNEMNKQCVFLDGDNKCKVYDVRGYNCFLPDSIVFTNDGPKKIKDIISGDYVVGKDGGLYIVENTWSKIYSGDIYEIFFAGSDLSISCTPEHKMLSLLSIDRRDKSKKELLWTEAKDLIEKKCKKRGSYLCFPINYEDCEDLLNISPLDYIKAKKEGDRLFSFTGKKNVFNNKAVSIPDHFIVDDGFLFILGIYLAEGSVTNNVVNFSFNSNEREYIDKVYEYFSNLELNPKIKYQGGNEGKSTCIVYICNSVFSKFIMELCGIYSNRKKINQRLFSSLSLKQKEKIYKAWDCGDGQKKLDFHLNSSVCTISYELLLQMQMISCQVYGVPRVYIENKNNRSNIVFNLVQNKLAKYKNSIKKGRYFIYQNYLCVPVSKVIKKYYNGPVCDIQVNKSESFVTNCGIAHNCRAFGLIPKKLYAQRVKQVQKNFPGIRLELSKQSDCCGGVKPSQYIGKNKLDDLFEQIRNLDKKFGVSQENIDQNNNYMTFHDHYILYIYSERLDILQMLTDIKTSATDEMKLKFLKDMENTLNMGRI